MAPFDQQFRLVGGSILLLILLAGFIIMRHSPLCKLL
jgi:hypothetical protein